MNEHREYDVIVISRGSVGHPQLITLVNEMYVYCYWRNSPFLNLNIVLYAADRGAKFISIMGRILARSRTRRPYSMRDFAFSSGA